ncbi:MAG: arylsulfatase [Candidatus Cryptobacteroides sp.]
MNALKETGLIMLGTMASMAADAQKRPNIILVLLDDVGYSDLGCYGSEIDTPNIDRLAENGIRMRHFYNSARSAPTRVSLMTGLYPHQAGQGALGRVPGYPAYQGYANDCNIFIPELLKTKGYFNIMTGKWHIGFDHNVTPISRGFDRSLNAPVGGYYFSTDVEKNPEMQGKGKKRLFRNDTLIQFNDHSLPEKWYSTDLWTKEGLKYVDEAIENGQPFFWYLAYNGAHFPLQAPQKTIDKYRGRYMEGWEKVRDERYGRQVRSGLFSPDEELTPRNPKIQDWDSLSIEEKEQQDLIMSIYAAVINEIDNGIGMITGHLEKKGVLDNTLIILLSDNGGNAEGGLYGKCNGKRPGAAGSNVWLGTAWADVSNTPFFLYKHHGHEGGCDTPLILFWPEGIDKKMNGRIDKTNYGHITDIMATLADITGAEYPSVRDGHKIPPIEGTSLFPVLEGKTVTREKPVIMEHEGNKMLREGKWKIVQEYSETEWMLYDISTDPTEMHDLSSSHPDLLKRLVDKYNSEAHRIGVEPEIPFKIGQWYTPVSDYLK